MEITPFLLLLPVFGLLVLVFKVLINVFRPRPRPRRRAKRRKRTRRRMHEDAASLISTDFSTDSEGGAKRESGATRDLVGARRDIGGGARRDLGGMRREDQNPFELLEVYDELCASDIWGDGVEADSNFRDIRGVEADSYIRDIRGVEADSYIRNIRGVEAARCIKGQEVEETASCKRGFQEAEEIASSIRGLGKEAMGKTASSISSVDKEATGKTPSSISRVSKEAPGEMTSEDAQRHQVQHEMKKMIHRMKGMDSYSIKVLHFLECTPVSFLGITGIRGVGKTTLLRLVHDHLADHSSFDYVLVVGAGTGCDVGNIQQSILATLLGPGHQIFDIPRAAEIISSSLKDKSFLLLVDDVTEWVDLVALGMPMPLGHQQKVIFTTVNDAICTEMRCVGNIIQMNCLGEEDAWELFKDEVGDEIIDTHPHFKRLAKQIVQECQGLPIALSIFGRAMSTRKDIKEWRYACNLLKVKRPGLDSGEYSWVDLSHLLMA